MWCDDCVPSGLGHPVTQHSTIAMPRPRNTPDLRGDRDRDILEHIARYRLSTPEILFNLFFEDDVVAPNAVTKVTSRLVERDFLRRFDLYNSHHYFTLGKRGAKAIGVKPKRVGAGLGKQALYKELGVLYFCACPQRRRKEREKQKLDPAYVPNTWVRLIQSEIDAEYPELHHRDNDRSCYYHDSSQHGEIPGLIWVDGGGDVEHVLRKVQQDLIAPRLELPGLRERIREGRFVVSIVTYLEEKRRQIAAAVPTLRTAVRFRVVTVPEIFQLQFARDAR